MASLDRMIGAAPAMVRLRGLIRQVAPSRLPILVQGPTGAGKELVAEALHELSGRTGRCVAFNVSAISPGMFEDALFGHVKGAFTGASSARAGYLREAHGGTMFLDEIDSLAVSFQAKLLRVLETGCFRPVGADRMARSDFRLVAATSKPLERLVAAGEFRDDLYHRIRGLVLRVPALRERIGDLPLLVDHYARKRPPYSFSPGAVALLRSHHWPGNIRELRNVIEASITLSEHPLVGAETVETVLGARAVRPRAVDRERRELEALLLECDGDTALVAERRDVHRATVYRWIHRFGIPLPSKDGAGSAAHGP
ncbi:MAG TPA: sigma 54-interacting transcriptional regulator [Longimicrobiales bacterium]|nr:sigma 54-interacting transcriptional regulator [Longimicrobiales bacterium]